MKSLKYYLPIITAFIISQNSIGQKIDYRDIRDKTMSLTCGPGIDSSDVFGSMRRLEALDTNQIGKNIYMYYEDLGICYWMASTKPGTDYLQKAVKANRSALHHKPKSTRAMWDIAFGYAMLNDCTQAKYYLGLYEKHTPKKYLDESHDQQVAQMLKKCHFD